MKILNWITKKSWLFFILFVAIGLRFYHLDFQSFWLDEVLTMNDTDPKLTFSQFYDSVLFWEAFPHLYFFLLKYFLLFFGYTTMVARIFSAIIGVFGVYSIYLLGKELFNKRTGQIAALLLSVSIYHISYSQEARPYGMLFLFTVLSFYRLVILIKKPNYRNAIYFGIFSGLMINSHFFGFLTILSQGIILLLFFLKTPFHNKKTLFKSLFVSAIIIFLLILPTYEPLLQILKIKTFWIPIPNENSLTSMFKEFFGNSEVLIFIIFVLIIHYFIQLFIQKKKTNTLEEIISNKKVFSFIILFIWFFISLIIPLIKSYLDVSMILTRYFINILPVFFIVIAISIELIKNKIIKNTVIFTFFIFSLLDLFIIKEYYHKPSKCQMRELTNEIKEKNTDNSKIVVYYSWVFSYFFQENPEIKMENYSLEDYIVGMKNNSIDKTSFWYANVNPYNLREEEEKYLVDNFICQEKIEYFDAWAYYYVPKTNRNIDLKSFNRVAFDKNGNMLLNEKTNTVSSFMVLEEGTHELIIKGNSLPLSSVNNGNTAIRIKINGIEIGNVILSDDIKNQEKSIVFATSENKKIRIQMIYDVLNQKNKKAIIYSMKINKK